MLQARRQGRLVGRVRKTSVAISERAKEKI
jgi:hypothetical protein